MRPLPVIPPLDLPGRRDVLRWIGIGTAAAMLPSCRSAPSLRFFTSAQAQSIGVLADAIFPPDSAPGAQQLGAVTYIDRLLSAFDPAVPEVFAGGPYSGRTPYANPDGTPSNNYPPDSFATFLGLDRVAEAAWRLYLYGSDAVGGGPNDAVLGKVVGLRNEVLNGLAAVEASARVPLALQSADELYVTLNAMDQNFLVTLVQLVSQGCLGVPEYGGNSNKGGWAICNYEGDQQPYGFTQYDQTAGKYIERADAPTSTANPGPDPDPMTDDVRSLISLAIGVLGGQQFQ